MTTDRPDAGPGCGHSMCLFERDCLILQAEAELEAARADRLHRREVGRLLAEALALRADEAPLFEVACYSPDLSCRIAAGALLVAALERLADERAA